MKRNFNLGIFALMLGMGIAVTQSSFTTAKKVQHRESTIQYAFTGTQLSDDLSASNYTVIDDQHPAPDCSGTALPCVISVDGDLQTWLDGQSDTDVRAAADSKRN